MANHIYPGWTLRFYLDDTVPGQVVNQLHDLGSGDGRGSARAGTNTPACCGGCKSPTNLVSHALDGSRCRQPPDLPRPARRRRVGGQRRPIPRYARPPLPQAAFIMGCGLRRRARAIPNMASMIRSWRQTTAKNVSYACDEAFLEAMVWPIVKDTALVHDTFGSHDGQVRPFPSPAEFGHYIGARVYEDNHGGHDDRLKFFRDYLAASKAPA